jgi:hypothetical protein
MIEIGQDYGFHIQAGSDNAGHYWIGAFGPSLNASSLALKGITDLPGTEILSTRPELDAAVPYNELVVWTQNSRIHDGKALAYARVIKEALEASGFPATVEEEIVDFSEEESLFAAEEFRELAAVMPNYDAMIPVKDDPPDNDPGEPEVNEAEEAEQYHPYLFRKIITKHDALTVPHVLTAHELAMLAGMNDYHILCLIDDGVLHEHLPIDSRNFANKLCLSATEAWDMLADNPAAQDELLYLCTTKKYLKKPPS